MSLLTNNKIIIHLDKHSFIPGDTIQGNIELAFTDSIKVDGITLGLLGINKRNNYSISQTNGMQYESNTHYFYNQSINLLGAGEYISQMIPFSFSIPVSILPKRAGSFENLGNLPPWAITIINIILSVIRLRQPVYIPEFSLEARADIPWGIDITEKVPISIEQKVEENINLPNAFSQEVNKNTEEA